MALLLTFFAVWNLSKLPFLWPYGETPPPMTNVTYDASQCASDPMTNTSVPRHCFGPETNPNMAAWRPLRFRSYKLIADASNFVAPHVALGALLELLLVVVLVGWVKPNKCAIAFFPLTVLFALHIIPVAHGIPARLANAPVNAVLIVLLLLTALAGHVGMVLRRLNFMVAQADTIIRACFVVAGILLNTAPVGEWGILAIGLATRNPQTGFWKVPEGDLPHPLSGHDLYARMQCPALGWFVTFMILFATPYLLCNITIPEAPTQLQTWMEKSGLSPPETVRRPSETNFAVDAMDLDGDGEVTAAEVMTVVKHEMSLLKRMRLCARTSCLHGEGPALWQLARPSSHFDTSTQVVPERYLEAAGETFILMIAVSWILTWLFNPEVIHSNALKDRVGYNNMCVGFDSPPARYVAMPLQVLQAYLAVRYVSWDSARAVLEKHRLTESQYLFTRITNWTYGGFMVCFPVLLVVTPEVSVVGHTYLFFAMIVVSFSVIAANFWEAKAITTATHP